MNSLSTPTTPTQLQSLAITLLTAFTSLLGKRDAAPATNRTLTSTSQRARTASRARVRERVQFFMLIPSRYHSALNDPTV